MPGVDSKHQCTHQTYHFLPAVLQVFALVFQTCFILPIPLAHLVKVHILTLFSCIIYLVLKGGPLTYAPDTSWGQINENLYTILSTTRINKVQHLLLLGLDHLCISLQIKTSLI